MMPDISVEIGFHARPLKEQFPELDEKVAKRFDDDNQEISDLRVRGMITNAALVIVRKRHVAKVVAAVQAARAPSKKA